ncbi:MAG: DUF1653 domain-containing protein [Desulfovibrionaceae bacterium]|nr:DUF1653 domain-containing protein [Desulfovibrionaceae bacterium]
MFFKHYKGRYYQSLGYVTDANNDSSMILYIPLYACEKRFFVREYIDFIQIVEYENKKVQRFTSIPEYQLPEDAKQYILHREDIGSMLALTKANHSMIIE